MCDFEALAESFTKTVNPGFRGGGKGFDDLRKLYVYSDSFMDNEPLFTVSEFVKSHSPNSRVAVIFDLDSTLFCVSPRTEAILRKLGSEDFFKSQFETAAETLRSIKVLPSDWGPRAVMQRLNPAGPIELFHAVRDFWRKHFFSSGFLHHDEIYPLADEYVRHLLAAGAEIFYLTGRPDKSMREGTLKALEKWNFPLKSNLHLLMKPDEQEADEHFKTTVLKKMAPEFDHIWFFENEPLIIDEVRVAVPQIRIVYVDTVHSGKSTPPTDLPRIGTGFSGRWKS